jgi:rRNA-processing protein FCF1
MTAVVDTSTLISLAWAGCLRIVALSPLELVVPQAVEREAVTDGIAAGYPDASAIESAIKSLRILPAVPASNVDEAVLLAALAVGALVTNDVALGRRANNLGSRWLRTADLIVLCVRVERISADSGRNALSALHTAGRLSAKLLADYREEV